jgi:membrane-anchored protein YejM (alkaline phosphatase superfamily)
MIMIWPNGPTASVVANYSSHYDIVPTLLTEALKCKNQSKDYSYGQSLMTANPRSHHVFGDYSDLGILDFNRNQVVRVKSYAGFSLTDSLGTQIAKEKVDEKMVLKALEEITHLYRRH